MEKITSKAARLNERHKKRNARFAAMGVALLAVAMVTVAAMRLPGFTQEKTAYCGMEEHTHTQECLSQEGGCPLDEHTHSLACYSNPQADVETQATWEQTVPAFDDDVPRLWRTVQIAKSQLGYHESSQNYLVEDGTAYGFTRYGAWVGNPYCKWNAQFLCFCLGYSGIDDAMFPRGSDADAWAEQLRASGKFVAADDPAYEPQPGDAVLLAKGDAHSIALVTNVDEATGEIRAIEGDSEDAVREVKFVPGNDALQKFSLPAPASAATDQVAMAAAQGDQSATATEQGNAPAPAEKPATQSSATAAHRDAQTAEAAVGRLGNDSTDAAKKAVMESAHADPAPATLASNADSSGTATSIFGGTVPAGGSSTKDAAQADVPSIFESTRQEAAKVISGQQKFRLATKTEQVDEANKANKTDEPGSTTPATDAQKSNDTARDDPNFVKGSSLLVDEGVASVAKLAQDAPNTQVAPGTQDVKDAQKPAATEAAPATTTTSAQAAADEAATGTAPDDAIAIVNPENPVVLGYGKMPDDLRKEYDEYEKLLAQRKAEQKAEQDQADGIEVVEKEKNADDESAAAKETVPSKAEGAEGAAGEATDPAQKEAARKDAPQVLTAQTTDGLQIAVDLAGRAKDGYKLEVKAIDPTSEQLGAVEEVLSKKLEGGAIKQARVDRSDVKVLDIRVLDMSGAEVEVGKTVNVKVKPLAKSEPQVKVESAEDLLPEVVHIKDGEAEQLEAKSQDGGFEFSTQSFSPFVFVYTVDFELEGVAWSMKGGTTEWLSDVLGELKANINIADVANAEFSKPELVEVTRQNKDDKPDWQLRSIKPFSSQESLRLTLANGDTLTIHAVDEDERGLFQGQDDGGGDSSVATTAIDISHRLDRVEFYDGGALVGDTMSPGNMAVRPGHEYTMRLHFSENENLSHAEGQFPDDGVMRYSIPNRVHLSKRAFDENSQVKFDILLDRKHTLAGNTVTYHEATGNQEAYIEIQWNTADAENFKLLKASPRTSFMLGFPYTTVDAGDESPIQFSSTAFLNVEKNPTYDVELEKTATPREGDPETIDYVVTAIADGNVENVLIADAMGEALTFNYPGDGGTEPASGITITYKKRTGVDENGNPTYADYTAAELPQEYGEQNKKDFHVAADDHGFDFKLGKLVNGDMAIIKYSAHVDYTKLGGKNNIETTSKNTVTAKDKDNLLDESSQSLDKNIDYLQLGKRRGEIQYMDSRGRVITDDGPVNGFEEGESLTTEHYVAENWKDMYVHWTVIYNPDHLISVEGATLKDTIWMGRKFATTYATDRDFKVTAYEKGAFTKDDGSRGDTFTPESEGHVIIAPSEENGHGWNDEKGAVTVTVANNGSDGGTQQLSSWEWTIPQIDATDGRADKPYTYVVEYWTKIARGDNSGDTGGYVGNQVTESIADITRDKSVELPGIGPDWAVTIDKEHVVDDYDDESGSVFSQWKVTFTFNRRDFDLERAIVEDTLPHLKITKEESADGVERILRDTFVNAPISEDPAHGWKVEGLYDATNNTDGRVERCVPSESADGYDVVFWFFKTGDAIENPTIDTPNQGLYGAAADATDEQKKITITFWTENDKEWIAASAEGKAPNEHWNHVHLVLNGKENVDNEFGVPKPRSEIKKSVEEAGSWTDGNTTLPVYRYTLSLNGLTDDAFIPVKDENQNVTGYNLVITDEFNGILNYLPKAQLPSCVDEATMTTGLTEVFAGKRLTLDGRSASDEVLTRPVPTTDQTWAALFSNPEVTVASTDDEDGKKKITITIPVTEQQREDMKYQVKAQDGSNLMAPVDPKVPDGEKKPVKVYGKSYEISYYLAPDFDKVKTKAQKKVDSKEYKNTKLAFENTATWENVDGKNGTSVVTATADYDLNPVGKKLLSYNSNTEVAKYSIDINPLKLTINNGQRYSVQDSYENMAVDFQTVEFKTDPPEAKNNIEWSYHGNKGTFWVPDETKVTITYEGWPVGKRGGSELTFTNTASIGGFVNNVSNKTQLSVDHEGYASTYRVRVFKFADDNMDKPLPGAVFQLFENGPNGEIRPMKYKADHESSIDDDIMWQVVNTNRTGEKFPTPENHKVGDNIYFVTGNGETGSADAGFADVMLSQSRDGVSLKKNKQYYLREVVEPNGYIKEDIDWRFIIGDNDDWERYVYSDNSILQVSNTSADPVLTVRKTFVDRSNNVAINYNDHQKDVQFVIEGKAFAEPHDVIYTKTVTYGDFMRVYKTKEDGTVERDEYVLTINGLPAGNYTVREVRSSATVNNTVLTTYVEGKATAKEVKDENEVEVTMDGSLRPVDTSVDNSGTTTGDDTVFHFKVLGNKEQGYLTKTTAEADFTNIYTDEDPVSVTVSKKWDNGGNKSFTPRQTEYTLYADGVKYPVTPAEGGNESGNIVLKAGNDSSDYWSNQITISGLPKRRAGAEADIVWTVEEVGATYHIDGRTADTTVSGFLREHFTVTANTAQIDNNTYHYALNDNSVTFTNKLNSLIELKVDKQWSDNNNAHANDSVFFDLYRTTENIQENTDYHALAKDEDSNLVIENIELNADNDWSYTNDMLEKFSENDSALYHYFVVERSVAGYVDSYARSTGSNNDQAVTITNTPRDIENNQPRGKLSITKNASGENLPTDFAKTYKFTLWNSGKYLHENGTLSNEEYVFSVEAGQGAKPTVFSDVKLGTYVLTEVTDAAQIGGYTLNSTTVSVNDGTAEDVTNDGRKSEVVVTESQTTGGAGEQTHTAENVVVTNTYTKDADPPKTSFTFGKLWVMPNPGDSTTLEWPKNVSTTMRVQRRNKITKAVDEHYIYTYVIPKGATADSIPNTVNSTVEGGPTLTVNNPDADTSASSAANYHHYTFKLDALEQYDNYGNEWEYFATEAAVTDISNAHNPVELLNNPGNSTGRSFSTEYGHVDGIGAYSYQQDADTESKTDASMTSDGSVECAINRLAITQTVDIPVQKFINGTANWGIAAGSNTASYPQFSFTLYDEFGNPVLDKSKNPDGVHITVTTDEHGQALFTLPETLINPNEMIWWPDEEILYGSHTFWIKEDDLEKPAAAGALDRFYEYYGIEKFTGSAKVTLAVRYDWKNSTLTSTARVSNGEYTHTDAQHREWAVINNAYKTDTTQLTVTKTWDDANNQDGYRTPVYFKVNASYVTKDPNGENDVHELDKVWLNKVVKTSSGSKIVREDDIVLNSSDQNVKEYRIVLEPGADTESTFSETVKLPKYYEGHVIKYTVEEMPEESIIEKGTGGDDDVTLEKKYTPVPAIARIGDTYYATLREAIEKASPNATIDLLADDTESFKTGDISIDKSLTINGNNHTVTGKLDKSGFTVQSGDVTISNLVMNTFGASPVSTANDYTGTLNLNNVDVKSFSGTAFSLNGGTFNINGGTINRGTGNTGILTSGTATGTVTGTTIRGDNGIVSGCTGADGVRLNNVDVVVTDTGIKVTAGTVSIPRDNATANNTYVKAAENNALVESGGNLIVEVGMYSNEVPSDCCAQNYVPSSQLDNGLWTIKWGQTAVPPVANNLVYNGKAQTGVASGTGYTVSDTSSATDAGKYTATLTLDAGYRWSDGTTANKQIEWSIDKATIDVPTAATGLVYNGEVQTGVKDGTGYTVTCGTGKDARSYTATVSPESNYQFSDGSASKEVDWSIAKAPVTVQANDASKEAGENDPTLTATVTGTFGSDTVSYTLVRDVSDTEGRYTITASGEAEQDNYTVTYKNGTLTILPADISDNAVAYTVDTNGNVIAHDTLEAAIAAASASNDHTVHLLKDVELTATLPVNNKVIIDGSNNGSTFTIKPSAGATSINPLISVSANGDLTLGNVTVDAKGTNNNVGRVIVVRGGKLTLNDGAKVTGGSTADSYIGGVYMTGKSEFTINGGEITDNKVSSNFENGYLQYSADLWIGSEAKGTMNGGKVDNLFVNSNEYAQESAGFKQNGGTITNAYLEYDKGQKASLTYRDGELKNLYIAQEDANGGSHATDPEHVTSLVKGATYAPGSGSVRLQSSNGTVKDYDSLKEAIDRAQPGDKIALLKDAQVSSMITLDKSLTIDLYGHTLSGASNTASVFQVVNDATLTMEGHTSGSTFVGRLNVGAATDNNGNITLNGGTYRCGDGQTVLHVNGTCTNSDVTITNAAITSPTDNGIQLNGAGTHSITNSTISGKTAVYLKAGTLTVTDSTLRSTATGHTDYSYNGNGSNPTGDAVVVDSCAYPGGNPTLHLGAGNTINVANNSNMQVGYYEYEANTSATGYKPGVVTAHSNDATLPDGYTWVKQSNGSYKVSNTHTVAFDSAGAGAVESQQVAHEHHAQKPTNPERSGKKFLGWFATDQDTPFDFDNKAITADTILTAKWEDAQFLPTGDPQYTNRHEPEKINVSVEKKWDHNDNPNEPSSIQVRLVATYGEGNNKVTITNDNIANYQSWNDYASQFAVMTLGTNDWSKTWQNLPRFAPGESGQLVSYTVEEIESSIPLGYHQLTTSEEDSDVKTETTAEPNETASNVLKNKYETIDIPIKKIWDDDTDRDGLRTQITSVTMTLTAKAGEESISLPSDSFTDKAGTKIESAKIVYGTSVTNEWTNASSSSPSEAAGWTGLPKYYHGKEIAYTVTEDSTTSSLAEYTASGDPAGTAVAAEGDSTGTRSVTNKHEIDRKAVKLTKTWLDNQNQDDKRPDILTYINNFVHIYATTDPVNYPHQKELVLGKQLTSGTSLYTYELNIKDANNTSEQYIVNGEPVVATLTGSNAHGHVTNTYTIECTELPAKENGQPITYTIVETDGDGIELKTKDSNHNSLKPKNGETTNDYSAYKIKVNMAEDAEHPGTFSVTNEYKPETTSLTVKKRNWIQKTGEAVTNPEEIKRLNNTVKVRLVAYEGEKRLSEEQISGWADTTNPHIDHAYNIDQTPALEEDGEYKWNELPVHDPESVGKVITYAVEEIECESGYHVTATSPTSIVASDTSQQKIIELTNTYEDTSIKATKVWDDGHNQDGERKQIKFQLQKLVGTESDTNTYAAVGGAEEKVVGGTGTSSSDVEATWTNLPAWEKNTRVTYRVVEVPFSNDEQFDSDYTKTEGTFSNVTRTSTSFDSTYEAIDTITNTYTPKTKTVIFTKTWDHKGVSGVLDSLGAQQYLDKLHLYAKEGDQIYEVTNAAESHWNPALFLNANDSSRDNNWQQHATVAKTDENKYSITVKDLPQNKPSGVDLGTKVPLTYFLSEDVNGSDTTSNLLNCYNIQYPTREDSTLPTDKITEGETLKNTRKTASLKIGKEVVSDLAEDGAKDFAFTITTNPKVTGTGYTYTKQPVSDGSQTGAIDFDSNGKTSVTLKHGQSIKIDGLPIGVEYTVAETQVSDFGAPVYKIDGASSYLSGTTCVIGLNTENQVRQVDFQNTRELGSLVVSKSIVSGVQSDASKKFRFEVHFTNLADSAKGKTFGDVTLNSEFKAQFELSSNGTKTISGLPVGAIYTIKEIFGDGTDAVSQDVLGKFKTSWAKTVAGSNGATNSPANTDSKEFPGAVENANAVVKEQTSVAFTNTRKTGQLKLTKIVKSPFTADTSASYPFTVTLRVPNEQLNGTGITTNYNSGATITYSNDGKATITANVSASNALIISGIPIDTQYTVTEDGFSSANDFDITTTYKGTGSSNEEASATHTVSTEATYEVETENKRKVLPVSIRKVSAENNNTGLAGAEFTLSLEGATQGADWYNEQLESTAASDGYLVKRSGASQTDPANVLYLPVGKYALTETKAPTGYNKLSAPITFEVTENGVVNFTESVLGKASSAVGQSNGVVPLLVGNSTGVELPSTGGLGMFPTYMLGVLLLACFLVLCFV